MILFEKPSSSLLEPSQWWWRVNPASSESAPFISFMKSNNGPESVSAEERMALRDVNRLPWMFINYISCWIWEWTEICHYPYHSLHFCFSYECSQGLAKVSLRILMLWLLFIWLTWGSLLNRAKRNTCIFHWSHFFPPPAGPWAPPGLLRQFYPVSWPPEPPITIHHRVIPRKHR